MTTWDTFDNPSDGYHETCMLHAKLSGNLQHKICPANQAMVSKQSTTHEHIVKFTTCCKVDGPGGVDAAPCVRAQHCEPVGRVLYL